MIKTGRFLSQGQSQSTIDGNNPSGTFGLTVIATFPPNRVL